MKASQLASLRRRGIIKFLLVAPSLLWTFGTLRMLNNYLAETNRTQLITLVPILFGLIFLALYFKLIYFGQHTDPEYFEVNSINAEKFLEEKNISKLRNALQVASMATGIQTASVKLYVFPKTADKWAVVYHKSASAKQLSTGANIYAGEKFIDSLSEEVITSVLIHELGHILQNDSFYGNFIHTLKQISNLALVIFFWFFAKEIGFTYAVFFYLWFFIFGSFVNNIYKRYGEHTADLYTVYTGYGSHFITFLKNKRQWYNYLWPTDFIFSIASTHPGYFSRKWTITFYQNRC